MSFCFSTIEVDCGTPQPIWQGVGMGAKLDDLFPSLTALDGLFFAWRNDKWLVSRKQAYPKIHGSIFLRDETTKWFVVYVSFFLIILRWFSLQEVPKQIRLRGKRCGSCKVQVAVEAAKSYGNCDGYCQHQGGWEDWIRARIHNRYWICGLNMVEHVWTLYILHASTCISVFARKKAFGSTQTVESCGVDPRCHGGPSNFFQLIFAAKQGGSRVFFVGGSDETSIDNRKSQKVSACYLEVMVSFWRESILQHFLQRLWDGTINPYRCVFKGVFFFSGQQKHVSMEIPLWMIQWIHWIAISWDESYGRNNLFQVDWVMRRHWVDGWKQIHQPRNTACLRTVYLPSKDPRYEYFL